MEEYLGPYMDWKDDGLFVLDTGERPEIVWAYERYHELKKRYYRKLLKKKPFPKQRND